MLMAYCMQEISVSDSAVKLLTRTAVQQKCYRSCCTSQSLVQAGPMNAESWSVVPVTFACAQVIYDQGCLKHAK